jgi:acetyl esterase/lipase
VDNRINAASRRIIAAISSVCLALGLFSASYGADEAPSVTRLFGANNYGDYRLQGGAKIQVAYNNGNLAVKDIVVKPASSLLESVVLVGGAPGGKNSPLNEVESVVYTSSGGSTTVTVEQLRGVQLARDNFILWVDSKPGWPFCELIIPWSCFESEETSPQSAFTPNGTSGTFLLGNPDTGKHIQNADSFTAAGANFYYHREGSPFEEGRFRLYTKYGQNLIIESEYTVELRTTHMGDYNESSGAIAAGGSALNLAAKTTGLIDGQYHAAVTVPAGSKKVSVEVAKDSIFADTNDPRVLYNIDFANYRKFGFIADDIRGSALSGGSAAGSVNYGVVGTSAGGQGTADAFVIDIRSDAALVAGDLEIDVAVFATAGTGFEVGRSEIPATVKVKLALGDPSGNDPGPDPLAFDYDSADRAVKTATIQYYEPFEGPQKAKVEPTFAYAAGTAKTLRYVSWENIVYVENPTDGNGASITGNGAPIQTMNIYMPEAYLTGGTVGSYTMETAPIFFPNTAYAGNNGAATQPTNSTHEAASINAMPNHIYTALERGFVVAIPACRNNVVDIKAAVRYLRHNKDSIPGDIDYIFTAGASAGGQLASLFGASGNNPAYDAQLAALGAVMDEKDDVFAVMAWSPMTNAPYQALGYAWQFDGVTTAQAQKYSYAAADIAPRELTAAQLANNAALKALYDDYINGLALADPFGTALTLSAAADSGAFYDYITGLIGLSAQRGYETPKWDSRYEIDAVTVNGSGAVTDIDLRELAAYITRMSGKGTTDASNYGADGKHLTQDDILTNPMNHLGVSDVAPYWRLRHGTDDRDTGLSTTTEFALALRKAGVEVDHAFEWDVPHRREYGLNELFTWIDGIVAQEWDAATAKAVSLSVTLNGSGAPAPTDAYEIDGYLYLPLTDIAKMVSGTAKEFGAELNGDHAKIRLIGAYSGGYSAANSSGAPAASAVKNFLTVNTSNSGNSFYPVRATVYEIGSNKYFRLDDIASAANFGMAYDKAGAALSISTSRGYDEYMDYYTGFPVPYNSATGKYEKPAYAHLLGGK